ncbi:cytochrome P450 [Mycena albidolilacea]|uniref:Cytochrome P450 n=1 Tax=Mycena albidolilacea TaxID=1033008 RepID=A0AAD7A234_9AGAR|nr:cytochrome P450 [Mycena albidolilacea]
MPLDLQGAILCASLAFGLVFYHALSRRSRSTLPLPPGPRKLPLVGNLLDIPADLAWEKYMEWSKEYNSDIIHLNLAGQSVIVLSSLEATEALLEKRSALYSDRSELHMVNGLMGWDSNVALMKYGDTWRKNRRLLRQGFNPAIYQPLELASTRTLLGRLLDSPDAFSAHFRQMAGEIIISMAYGIDVLPSEDPYVVLASKGVHSLIVALLNWYLVDFFPALKYVPKWFPGAEFKRKAEEWRKLARAMVDVPYTETKRQMECGIAPRSFTSDALHTLRESDDGSYYGEEDIKASAGTMFAAGTDTTVSALSTFFLAMLVNPEAQRKAQTEIDAVTGGKYLPDFDDEAAMPYVSALVKEVLRWKNVTPIAIPHFLATEDEYRGYRLPADSIVIGSTWAILHDELMYPDPYAFKPERFLLAGKLNPAVKDPDCAAFGFGRRICPGRHMARSSVWIAVVSILATFNIDKAVDEAGHVIEPTFEYLTALVSAPLPFKCSITPRSNEAAKLIRGIVH